MLKIEQCHSNNTGRKYWKYFDIRKNCETGYSL